MSSNTITCVALHQIQFDIHFACSPSMRLLVWCLLLGSFLVAGEIKQILVEHRIGSKGDWTVRGSLSFPNHLGSPLHRDQPLIDKHDFEQVIPEDWFEQLSTADSSEVYFIRAREEGSHVVVSSSVPMVRPFAGMFLFLSVRISKLSNKPSSRIKSLSPSPPRGPCLAFMRGRCSLGVPQIARPPSL